MLTVTVLPLIEAIRALIAATCAWACLISALILARVFLFLTVSRLLLAAEIFDSRSFLTAWSFETVFFLASEVSLALPVAILSSRSAMLALIWTFFALLRVGSFSFALAVASLFCRSAMSAVILALIFRRRIASSVWNHWFFMFAKSALTPARVLPIALATGAIKGLIRAHALVNLNSRVSH